MCVYCHEFIKRNRPVCGYCHKVFPVVVPKDDQITTNVQDKHSFRNIAALVLATIALGLVVLGAVDVFLLKPELLETVEISEPASIELVELVPYEPWIH